MNIALLDLFSGIGGFHLAAKLATKDLSVPFKCIGFSEIDKYASQCYKIFFEDDTPIELGDISTFSRNPTAVDDLPHFNLLTAGFPCQPFSMMGKKKGFLDHRGSLFFEILNILERRMPSLVLLENVKNISKHDNGKTISTICKCLEKIGYKYVKYDIFDTSSFGLPQKRNRVYILAIKKPKSQLIFDFKSVKHFYESNMNESILTFKSVLDILEKKVDARYYLSQKIKPTILANGGGRFVSRSEINQIIARPLVATMVKMHRACQDNYYSDDFILSNGSINNSSEPLDSLQKKAIRKITPLEAFTLQGFPEKFVKLAIKSGISNHQLYKQAGNAASVNVVYSILSYLFYNSDKYEI